MEISRLFAFVTLLPVSALQRQFSASRVMKAKLLDKVADTEKHDCLIDLS
jgi:hypothetical protein